MTESPPQSKGKSTRGSVQEMLVALGAVIIPLGLVVYGLSSIGYFAFYGRLGVDPSDVGFNYVSILAHATGLVIFLGFFLGPLYIFLWRLRTTPTRLSAGLRHPVVVGVLLVSVLVTTAVSFGLVAANDADHVKKGRAVSTYGFAWLPLSSYHADVVVIEASGKPDDAPAIEQLGPRRLLYLGQSDGIAVVYDHCAERVVHLPIADTVMHIAKAPGRNVKQEVPSCEQNGG